MATVVDYSAGFPGAARIRAAGHVGAVRYIGFPDRRKCTTTGELAEFTAHGLGMALVYEDHADDWRGGYNQGRDAGRRARTHAAAVGFPAGRPIYLAVDRDVVTDAEFRTMVQYLAGAQTTLGGPAVTGVYGEHDVCARAARDGVASWFWQCRAWSGTPVRLFAGRHLYQRVGTTTVGGIGCDINDVLQSDWGQHLEVDDVTPTDLLDATIPNLTGGEPVTVRDVLAQLYRQAAIALPLAGRPAGDTDDAYGHVLSTRAELRQLAAKVDQLIDRPPTERDEAELAAALGLVLAPLIQAGATPSQVDDAVRRAFARAGHPEGSIT